MKKINFFIAILSLTFFFTSCSEDDNDVSTPELQTTSVMSILETSLDNNTAGRTPTDRPGSVLDWIETIEITADHVGTIGAPYSVSDTYTMIDDGSGADNFVLENVALGENKFEAFAKSYNQTPAKDWAFVVDAADAPWQWIDSQRLRAPNANFRDTDNATQTIFENPAAGQNVVNFDMKAESGRLIVAVKLSDAIRNQFFSNYVYVKYRVKNSDGTVDPWSDAYEFNSVHKDDLLTLYFSDNTLSKKDACVEFSFIVNDAVSPETNTFTREICIPDNGKSLGCVFEVDEDAVIEDVTDFNFTFDWEEIDCFPCAGDEYVTVVPRAVGGEAKIQEFCDDNTPFGVWDAVMGVTPFLDALGEALVDSRINDSLLTNGEGTIIQLNNTDGTGSGWFLVVNGQENGGFGFQHTNDGIDSSTGLATGVAILLKVDAGKSVEIRQGNTVIVQGYTSTGFDRCN